MRKDATGNNRIKREKARLRAILDGPDGIPVILASRVASGEISLCLVTNHLSEAHRGIHWLIWRRIMRKHALTSPRGAASQS